MAAQRLRQGDQFPGILFRIIHTTHQTVFESDPSSGLFEIILTDFHQLFDRIPVGNGHQFSSFFIGGGMQGQCQCDLQLFIRQLPHSGHDSTGGHRDISLADVQTVLICQKMQKFQNIVIIIHRFPSAHDYHIGDPFPRQSCDGVNLIQHLGRSQIPFQSVQSGSTEFTAHAASHL